MSFTPRFDFVQPNGRPNLLIVEMRAAYDLRNHRPPIYRASRSSAPPLAQPMASGRGLEDLKRVGMLSGEICRPEVVGRIRYAVIV